jgi:hypothetical protein
LSITDSTQGFSLVGNGGITQISPQSIGTYDSFRNKSNSIINLTSTDNEPGTDDAQGNFLFNFTNIYPVGTVQSGKTITVSFGTNTYRKYNGTTIPSGYSETAITYTVFENDVQKATGSLTPSTVWSFTYTSAGGNIKVNIDTNVRIPGTVFGDTTSYIPSVYKKLDIRVTIPNDAYMLIGYDGLAVNFGTSATAYFGAESTTINYGNYGLQISSSGVKRLVGNGVWRSLNCLNITPITSNYTLTKDDEFILYTGNAGATITLGSGWETGRMIYVKDRGRGGVTLNGNIYRQNSASASTSYSIDDTMVFLIWDGSAWNLGYCG